MHRTHATLHASHACARASLSPNSPLESERGSVTLLAGAMSHRPLAAQHMLREQAVANANDQPLRVDRP